MIYIFDSSFVCALVIPDEKNHQVDKMYNKIENEDERYSPHLLWYEITNVFKNLIRRKRYNNNEVINFYPRFIALDISYDYTSGVEYSKKLLSLCNEFNLSAYDAAFLELAERKNAILCTMDENLRAVAKKRGVAFLK